MMNKRLLPILLAALILSAAAYVSCGSNAGNADPTEPDVTEPAVQAPQHNVPEDLIVSLVKKGAGTWNVYNVRTPDRSLEYLEIAITESYDLARTNMLTQRDHINRIAAANPNVNLWIFIGTTAQDMPYFNQIIPETLEPCLADLFEEFHSTLVGVAGVTWLDLDTFDKRLEYIFKTDHHWTAKGAYKGYTQMVEMMSAVYPDIGDPLPLKGIIEFPNVWYRGSRASRTNFSQYYDIFAVMDIDLPPHSPKVTSKINDYRDGKFDNGRLKDIYAGMYDGFYGVPGKITYTDNKTGRNLLLLGDSFASWVSFLIGSHFDTLYNYGGGVIDYNKYIRDNNITDVLILQSGSRMVYKSALSNLYLEAVTTR